MKTLTTAFAVLSLSLSVSALTACGAAPSENVANDSQDLDVCKDVILPIVAPGVKPAADCPAGEACAPGGFDEVTPSVYRGGHPKDDGMMDYLKEKGVASIVTLEMPATTLQGKIESFCQHDGIPDESRRAAARDIAFHALGIDPTKDVVDLEQQGGGLGNGTDAVDRQIEAALDEMKRATPDAPVYVHCTLGVDRTGLVVALHRIRNQGWSARDAAQEWIDHLYGSPSWTPGRTRCQEFRTLDETFNRWVERVSPDDGFRIDPSSPSCGL